MAPKKPPAATAPAAGLLPEERALTLADGLPRKMKWNFRALAVVEQMESRYPDAGGLMKLAQFAYALTATHRQRTDDSLSFEEFVDLMPAEPEAIARVTESITACLPGYMRGEPVAQGNE